VLERTTCTVRDRHGTPDDVAFPMIYHAAVGAGFGRRPTDDETALR